mmetsp:Transcript_38/g.73  ORF Transcript_38/g.73 Transcript_38/m.73 type:complete len:235 (-) Transcript_38:7-711(-)
MAPGPDEDRRRELKAKVAQKASGSHNTKRETKAQAKARAEKEAQDRAAKNAKAQADARAAQAKAAAAAGPWALEGEEAQELGIHLGISCDGCGQGPPLIGRAMKCRDCRDFDLCDDCFPLRLDAAREKIAAAAGMPGKGRHPAAHHFGARRAASVMTTEAVAAEKFAARQAAAAAKDKVVEANSTSSVVTQAGIEANESKAAGPESTRMAWRPSPRNAEFLPMAHGPPTVLRPA